MSYDSRVDTYEHIAKVGSYLLRAITSLHYRALDHDRSKLESPEREMFDEYTPKLRDTAYGSEEYKGFLREMGAAVEHHYEHNSHHPEHFENGVRGMSLLDLIEMLCDWQAAGERHADGGDLMRSIAANQERFGYGDELRAILENTAREMGL